MLDGLKRILINRSFTYSSAVENSIKDYRTQSDSVRLFLEDEGYVTNNEMNMKLNDFYSVYREYCENYGYRPCALRSFGDRLRNLDILVVRQTKGNVVGVKKIII